MGEFPSGQRGQTVNLLLSASMVRIHPLPPIIKGHPIGCPFIIGGTKCALRARVAHLTSLCAKYNTSLCRMFGEYRYDEYGKTTIKFVIIASDNSYVDPANKELLKNYIVTAQNVEPNTELKLVFIALFVLLCYNY